MGTDEWGAAWTSVEPQSDGVFVVSPFDRLNKHIVNGPFLRLDIKIPSIDTCIVIWRVALCYQDGTGILSILSAAGAQVAIVMIVKIQIAIFVI